MNRSLIICDQLMYGALLGMIFFLPYSFALIETCQIILFVAWAGKCILQGQKAFPRGQNPQGFSFASGMGWALIAIGLLIVLTIPFSHYPSLSIKKFFTRFLQQILLMYLITQIVCSRKRLYSILLVLLTTLFFVCVDIMIQFFSGSSFVHHTPLIFGRVSGPMNHPNDLGTLLVTVLPVVLVLMITYRTWIPLFGPSELQGRKMTWVGLFVVSALFFFLFLALGFTASRGAWVAFAVSMITLGVGLNRKRVTILIILILMIFLGVFGIHCLSTRFDMYVSRPVLNPSVSNPVGLPSGYNGFEVLTDTSGREVYWGTALGVIKHYPWFGCGYNAYVQTLRDLNVGHEEDPHNSLLHITAELGVIGLILYGWFFIALFLQIKNVLQVISVDRDLFILGGGISAGIFAWFIHSLMDTAWTSLQLSILWWVCIGILLSLRIIVNEPKGRISKIN